jgi:hypothetical protein
LKLTVREGASEEKIYMRFPIMPFLHILAAFTCISIFDRGEASAEFDFPGLPGLSKINDIPPPNFDDDFGNLINEEAACKVLFQNLNRNNLNSQRIIIGNYTDIFTPPKLKTECSSIIELPVKDLTSCRTEYDPCASEWSAPPFARGCIPGTRTECSNATACNAWKHFKQTMECQIVFELKIPSFTSEPISKFVDYDSKLKWSARRILRSGSLPLACAPRNIRRASPQEIGDALAAAVAKEIESRIRKRIEAEVREWLQETTLQTIAAAIPSAGIGGGAVMSTKLATFVYRVHKAIKPILKVAEEVSDLAENVGFSTSCGWSEWHQWLR